MENEDINISKNKDNNIYLTIVVPAYNEEKNIRECILSIFEDLKNVDINYEVLVINDGSHDRTSEIIRDLMKKYNKLRFIDRKENRGYGYTVLEGLKEAKGNIVLYIDADCVVERGSIYKIVEHYKRGVDAVFGYVDVANPEHLHPLVCKIGKKYNKESRFGGAMMSFRKEVLKELGGPSLESGAGYDAELKYRLKRGKYNVIYEDQAKVYSKFPTGIKDILKRKYLAGKSYIVMSSRYPEIFKKGIIIGPTFYFMFLISILLFVTTANLYFLITTSILICIFLVKYTPRATEIYKESKKISFFFLYYIYEFLAGIARSLGYLSELGKFIKLMMAKHNND